MLWKSSVSLERPDQSSYERRCKEFVEISSEIANPNLVGYSTVSSLMYTTFVLTRALDAKLISDEHFIHSFTCDVHQTAFSPMYRLVHLHPTHDADNDG